MIETFATIDAETTVNNTVGNNKASPFCYSNRIVLLGGKLYADGHVVNVGEPHVLRPINIGHNTIGDKTIKLLVGHNIKFDLHYLRKERAKIQGVPIKEWLATPGNGVWDTQVVEYLLTGQQTKFASLDELSVKYGGTTKPEEIKAMWEAGIKTEDMDRELLQQYLIGDIENTERVAVAQMEEADRRGILPLIHAQMDALCAYEEMEWNGMHIDVEELNEKKEEIAARIALITENLVTIIKDEFTIPDEYEINLNSNALISALIFGGTLRYKEKVQVGTYKNGKPRFKATDKTFDIPDNTDPMVTKYKESTATPGVYKVDEAVLKNIHRIATNPTARRFLHDILERKKLNKELTTYYEGISKLIYPDGKVHPNIQQCATDTGRTSSSEPNSQNMPASDESEVRKLFISRHGEDGCIVSVDYKQLEVVALAFLSRDRQLMDDIKNGVDIHTGVGRTLYGPAHKMTKEERRVVKTINFGLIYGGTATTLAEQANCTKGFAQTVIDAFYIRYPGVQKWQNASVKAVQAMAHSSPLTTKSGIPAMMSTMHSATGRAYVFTEYDNPWRPGTKNFSPTEIKNYPVQGLATGDIVPTMVGVLWRALKNSKFKDTALMINVVHDELVLDVMIHDHTTEFQDFVTGILEDAPKYLKDIYNIEFDLPLKVSYSFGNNWKEQAEVATF